MIEVQDLHKSFKTKTGVVKAVQGVSFTAQDGEITGLLGPNGAGKTTTLRMLYTLMNPDQGSVKVDGFDSIKEAEDVRRRLGVLPDARGVYKRNFQAHLVWKMYWIANPKVSLKVSVQKLRLHVH